ncbi:hypothetical protein C8J57DRAFT_1544097 [Mycena rebaudengoi]|nr:hypothetical protein C8J57DRAFT_1544097 [Mycena rebaudengoi]
MRGPVSAKGEAEAPNRTSALPDVLWTSLRALKESADTFPPLKSVVGGVVAIWDIAEVNGLYYRHLSNSRRPAREALQDRGPRHRAPDKKIVDLIADAVPDPSEIPPSMLLSIDRFTFALDEIDAAWRLSLSGSLSRLVHLNHHNRTNKALKLDLM